MAENRCTGNCMACTILQRQYCASQLAYSNMRMLEQMQSNIEKLSEKIDAMQNNEAALFDPTVEINDTAQSEDGAESRSLETI